MPNKELDTKATKGNYKLPAAKMSGRSYDMKEAYNKNLTASARLHYLENERHDKDKKSGGSIISKHMGGRMHGKSKPATKMHHAASKHGYAVKEYGKPMAKMGYPASKKGVKDAYTEDMPIKTDMNPNKKGA